MRSAGFEPGLTYRILRAADGKVGMYQLLRGGARLDSEFFPESQGRRRFAGLSDYGAFLRDRNVDRVIAFANYDALVHDGNERELLRACGRLVADDGVRQPFAVYDVGPCVDSHSR